MAAKTAGKPKKRAGRPVDPASLRQAGTWLQIRVTTDERDRVERLATRDGLSISDFVRRRCGL